MLFKRLLRWADGQVDRSPGRHRCLGYLSLHVVQMFTYNGQMDRLTGHQVDIDTKADLSLLYVLNV